MSLIIFGSRGFSSSSIASEHSSLYTLRENINQYHSAGYSLLASDTNISQYTIVDFPVITHISTYAIWTSAEHISGYGIFISSEEKERYIISKYVPPKIHTSSYSIYISPGHQLSEYGILVQFDNLSSFTIYTAASNDGLYDVKITSAASSTHRAKYKLDQIYYAENVSNYRIRPDNFTSADHYANYRFLESMVRGITDRFCCQWNAWQTFIDDKQIHLHLFNTYDDNKTIAYERFYSLASQKDILLEREVTFSEKEIVFSFYEIYDNDILLLTGSYHINTTDRSCVCAVFEEHIDQRSVIALQLLHTQTERDCVWWSAYDDYRYCLAKTWYVSELWCVTHAKERDRIATQRDMWAQIDEIHFESIRQVMYSCCSLSYDLLINPIYTEFQYVISEEQNILFESTVTPETSSYLNIPLNDDLSDLDIIILEKGSELPYYCGREALIKLKFKQISSRSWMFDGYICAFKNVSFVKTIFEFISKGVYDTDEEYFDYLNNHGYLKVQIGDEEMYYRESFVNDIAENTLIPFKIWAIDTEIDKQNINILFKWAYPYSSLKINEVMLVATRTY